MANRFARRIRDGDIGTPEELKAEFKAMAKATHPDLAGPGFAHEFIRVREEYESALRDFGRHRFGIRRPAPRERDRQGKAGEAAHAGSADAFAAIGLLRKRGFPKLPRHRKETLRYEYARWCCRRALTGLGESPAAFDRFEAALLDLRSRDDPALDRALRYLDALVEYAALGLPELRTALLLDLSALRADPAMPGGVTAFLEALSRSLGKGSALPA